MGFIKTETLGIIEFISPRDDAIDIDLNEETGEPKSNIEKYKDTWDFEKYCQLKPGKQPTKFKLNFALSNKRQMIIDNASLGGDGKKDEFGFKLGNHKYWTVKVLLVGIENPVDIPANSKLIFRIGKDGYVHDDLMEELRKFGLVEEIYSFYLSNKDNTELLKKK